VRFMGTVSGPAGMIISATFGPTKSITSRNCGTNDSKKRVTNILKAVRRQQKSQSRGSREGSQVRGRLVLDGCVGFQFSIFALLTTPRREQHKVGCCGP